MESVRQAHAPQDVLELWIGANLIEAQVRKNPGVHRALGVRSFEPLQCPFTLAEALKNELCIREERASFAPASASAQERFRLRLERPRRLEHVPDTSALMRRVSVRRRLPAIPPGLPAFVRFVSTTMPQCNHQ